MRQSRSGVIVTCAVTGNITRPDQTPHLPISPEQIAVACLEAYEAGAAAVHIHVRDPTTGAPSMDVDLYAVVVERLRRDAPELIINLTTGPGGRYAPSAENPAVAGPGTTLLPPFPRVEHVVALKPDICTLDLNTMNSGNQVVINTPSAVREMAKYIRQSGARPEIELFDTGDIALLHDLIADGSVDPAPLCSFVMGVKYGFQFRPETVLFARDLLPEGAEFTAIGLGRWSFQAVAQSFMAGGHVRVGLEDAIYIDKGRLATSNAELVAKAVRLVQDLGGEALSAAQAREVLNLKKTNGADTATL